MRVCGVELSGSEARLAVVELDQEGGPKYIELSTKRVKLSNDKSSEAIKSFKSAIQSFVHENSIQVVCIKDRAHKGKFAGGAVSFKLESLIQSIDGCDVKFVSPQALSSFAKKNYAGTPTGIPGYLKTAFSSAAFLLAAQE
ncbi:hypothetical protein LCGC14_0670130 [marine sediment metagenome]|uniref:DUF3010 domain-containing protein n=1 Tax=marine sediment metagenome TaxID=412755 RepID=A0A0F9TCI4_9ZZZZ